MPPASTRPRHPAGGCSQHIPEGCQPVAGGERSDTTGTHRPLVPSTPEGCQPRRVARVRGRARSDATQRAAWAVAGIPPGCTGSWGGSVSGGVASLNHRRHAAMPPASTGPRHPADRCPNAGSADVHVRSPHPPPLSPTTSGCTARRMGRCWHPSGMHGFLGRIGDRWCRFAQPPATRCDASGIHRALVKDAARRRAARSS